MSGKHGGARPGSGPRNPKRRTQHHYRATPAEKADALIAIADQTGMGSVSQVVHALASGQWILARPS